MMCFIYRILIMFGPRSIIQVGDVVPVVSSNGNVAKATVVGFGHRSSKPRSAFTVILTFLVLLAEPRQ